MAVTLFDQLASGQAPPVVPLTVTQIHEMLEAGWLADGEPVELVEGVLVRKDRSGLGESKMTHGKRHSSAVAMLRRLDRLLDQRGCHLRSQLPTTLSPTSELEPDGAIVSGRDDGYQDHHPGPADVLVVIEISDSSLLFDRGTKLRLYAMASIAVYVIVNLAEPKVEVYSEPEASTGRYRARRDYTAREILELPLPAGSVAVPCSDLLPD